MYLEENIFDAYFATEVTIIVVVAAVLTTSYN
jgi:hypothetical protein